MLTKKKEPYVFPYGRTMFKGVELETGDFVAFRTSKVPLPEVQAAVMGVEKDGRLSVFSPFLVPFQHNGVFAEDEVTELMVVYAAETAIPQETEGKAFRKGERIGGEVKGDRFEGKAVAAFGGVVVGLTDDGQSFFGGVKFFDKVVGQ